MATTIREIAERAGGLTEEELDAPLVLDTNGTGDGWELEVELVSTPLEGGGVAFVCAQGSLIYALDYFEAEDECANCGNDIDASGFDATGSRRCDDLDPAHKFHQA